MPKVLYEKDGRIGRITLNRPEKLNAIDDDVPGELAAAVGEAGSDPDIHVIVLSGKGKAFCGGYDLSAYAEGEGPNSVFQGQDWDPLKDYAFMWKNTQQFMSLWRCPKPVLCKVHGFAVGGGSDIALCADMVFMAETARIGYMSSRVWGCPTTAMWVYRVGPEKAKRILFTGDQIGGTEAAEMGLVLKAPPEDRLDEEVEAMADRLASVPVNQLAMQKMVINQAVEATGLAGTQQLATLLDGIARHTPEGQNFKRRVETVGWRQAVQERDEGTFDWTENRPLSRNEGMRRRPHINYEEMGIPIGSTLHAVGYTETAEVLSPRKIMFRGEETYLLPATRKLTGKKRISDICKYWTYNGESLSDLYTATYGELGEWPRSASRPH